MNLDSSIFRAYDIRGVVGQNLTPAVVTAIGRAIGSTARARGLERIAVARDGRLSGPELLHALTAGLCASGCTVLNIGLVPTPVLYYAAYERAAGSGVMLTGSHNPPDYNGLKIMLGGDTLAEDAITALQRRILAASILGGAGIAQPCPLEPVDLARFVGDVRLARPLHVVIDAGNGAAGTLAPRLLEALGCRVEALYCDIDGHFPNHHPDPSKPENLADLIARVKATGADLGLAFDGDGDRLGVVTGSGHIIWPDRILMLLARAVLARNPGATVLYDVKCTRHLDTVIRQAGGVPLLWKTGHSLIKAKMKETGALLAGELSGHIFYKERWYGFDDALYTAARLLEALSADPRASEDVFAELPDSHNTPEINLPMAEGAHHRFMQRLVRTATLDGARLTTIDGLRADFPDGFGLVRASNTTPCLVLRFEGDDDNALQRIRAVFQALLARHDPSLILPP